MQWELRHPSSFHAALFVMVFLIAVTFEPLYPLARFTVAVAETTIKLTAVTLTTALHR